MSTSSIRRMKERGGGGAKVAAAKPSKTLTPISDKLAGDAFKKSAGKENPRPISRVPAMSQKPAIRPMPRIDKLSAGSGSDGQTRTRWSTSSVPRGRSSSPSEFTRLLSDLRKDPVPRVSVERCRKGSMGDSDRSASSGGKGLVGVRVSERVQQRKGLRDSGLKVNERSDNGIRVLRDCDDNVNLGAEKKGERILDGELELKVEEREKGLTGVRVLDNCKVDVNLSLNSIKLGKVDVNGGLGGIESCKNECNLDSNGTALDGNSVTKECKQESQSVLKSDGAVEKVANCVDPCSKGLGKKSTNNMKVSEILKEKRLSEDGTGARLGNTYPSKLHEKLAFLEGKVKRIASDIKKTKEILDMNNPDASKVILSDIQDKISGIEKAMSHVISDSDGNMGSAKTVENDEGRTKMVEVSQEKQADHVKGSVQGLNNEELEARLLPHQKLLRNRTSLKTLSESSQSYQPHVVELGCEQRLEDKTLSPIDENPIAQEFLASLNKEQSKVNARNGHLGLDFCEVQDMDGAETSEIQDSSNMLKGKFDAELILTTNEALEDFDDQENREAMIIEEEIEDTSIYQLNEIGRKTSTGGWFVSEGESVLLAHDDGSCSFYDIANCEEKAEYMPPTGVSPNVWRDCWVIRAPGADGCSGRYVVAASAGNTMDSGFCSWDFYTKDVRAFHIEDGTIASRTVLGPLPNNSLYRRNSLSTILAPENRQWWYKPCGPLIISTASCQRVVKIYDIRDGEQIMKWEVLKPVLTMDYSSPLQWRNRGKVVVAEAETISLWDVSSLNPQALLSVSSAGRKISALHVNNTDAELGGGVRQRSSSSEAEGNDGVFCTTDFINILDFRHPSGVGLKIPKLGINVQSVFSRGDSIFLGCTNVRSSGKKQSSSQVQQFSLRKQRLVSTYALPESNAHSHYTAITQVWGNSNLVMGVCGLGLFVFDALKDDGLQPFTIDYGNPQKVRETIGPDDLYSPSFDYSSSRALLISRDRPALWRHLS
ncbi:hypothetical protein L1049_017091 [Liquidambar formosana]|uniref:At4g14310 8-bladed propeller domain-containing protein n=1 Tax=Liquidambar formosana TaxID=63359 RepID=A0AAP0S6S3_LIQFO